MDILGLVNVPDDAITSNSLHVIATTTSKTQYPKIVWPYRRNVSMQILLYDRPNPTRMQYMSLNPIKLVLGDKEQGIIGNALDLDSVEGQDLLNRQRKGALVEKINQHTIIHHEVSQKELCLPAIIHQINCSYELWQLMQQNSGMIGARSKRSLSVGERVVESATTVWEFIFNYVWGLITIWIYPALLQCFIVGLICHRVIAEMVLRVLEWRLRPEYAALKDISATAQQCDIRLQQFCYWPIQYLKLRRRKRNWESFTDSHPDYIRFYNSLWLVANDVIIGIALGSYIIDNAPWVAYQIDRIITGYTVEGLQRMISWLMDWPAGLKLNNELAAFLGDLFLWVIEYWSGKVYKPYKLRDETS
jgi:phosphatidylinositol glycan class Q protein